MNNVVGISELVLSQKQMEGKHCQILITFCGYMSFVEFYFIILEEV